MAYTTIKVIGTTEILGVDPHRYCAEGKELCRRSDPHSGVWDTVCDKLHGKGIWYAHHKDGSGGCNGPKCGWATLMECPSCSEVLADDVFEDGECPSCIKKRDAAEAKADELKEQATAMKRLGTIDAMGWS